ncbi:MAG: hypothetical protein F6K31_38550 [Symploca sp. SIO2G7]|nr:hypothetical protein [Symploca sp. SIO2G7]
MDALDALDAVTRRRGDTETRRHGVEINSILVTCYLLLVTFYFLNCSHLTS